MKDIILLECTGGAVSKIVIGNAEENLPALLPVDPKDVIIITDANVHRNNLGFINSFRHIVIGQGDSSKTLRTVEETYRKLLELEADRNTFILGMGGGTVTDITGFVAGTFMRGVRFGFIATTLLAQVDACIGGKNGVNLDGYKNIIGLIEQPDFVICDPDKLRTLPEREFRAGLAEVIKAGIIGDPKLFEMFEKYGTDNIKNDPALLREMISRAIKVKAGIVSKDERERGERRKLNMGHTFAHAMEKIAPGTSHGEAVAAGLAMMTEAAVKLGKLPAQDGERIRNVITGAGLPESYPVETKRLLSAVKYDKKRAGKNIDIVFPTGIGEGEVARMTFGELEELVMPEVAIA